MRPVARAKGQGTIVPIGASPTGQKRWRVAVTMADGHRVWRTAHSLREAERIAGLRSARTARVRPTTLDHYALIVERHIIPALGSVKLSATRPTPSPSRKPAPCSPRPARTGWAPCGGWPSSRGCGRASCWGSRGTTWRPMP